jgi:sulfatase maturation enzyme AslB (radical SAM superfamily)
MSEENILKKYVCTQPFKTLDVQHFGNYMCCPSWLPVDISNTKSGSPLSVTDSWFGDIANKVRESVLDGSYRFCDKKVCPELNNLINEGSVSPVFVPREDFVVTETPMPENLIYGQDRSCNLKCPSCRKEVIPNDNINSPAHLKKQAVQDEIENSFGKSIKRISLTGSGDPIYSKVYRDFLQNFKKENYPNIESIKIISNGVLLTEKMWNSFNCAEFIDVIDISLDAGCKETYENVTRLGGDWDRLLENIGFLARLRDRDRLFVFSNVISHHNYKEMVLMYEVVDQIFRDNGRPMNFFVNFRQHVFWETGLYTPEQVNSISVFDPDHPEHRLFLEEVKKINNYDNVHHNFHHLMVQNYAE